MNRNYPEELTLDEFDDHHWDFVKISEGGAKIDRLAKMYLGMRYTQVDGENDRVYLRGVHVVNATGVYAFVYNREYHETPSGLMTK